MTEKTVSIRTYILIWAALMFLLAATLGLDFVDMGRWNSVAAMGIAIIKALLVAFYFMHLGYGQRLNWVFALAGFFFLLIMVSLSMNDYTTRPAQAVPGASTPTSIR